MSKPDVMELEALGGAEAVNFCEDCWTAYGATHRCSNPKPTDGEMRPYYYSRRAYLMRAGRFEESDNDPASPEQAWA